MGGSLYWLLVALLFAVGFVGMLSIGAPFLLLGATLALLNPYRNQPRVFWPWLVGVVGFIGGYIVIAPLGCTASAVSATRMGEPARIAVERSEVVCSSVFGLPYSGTVPYEPPMWPAFLAGLTLAVALGWTTRLIFLKRSRGDDSASPAVL
ncbi:MAG: hypothetical protein M3N24_03845 [Actinomycetota bacterium]|nr:hypothetical protein [Actinomycetota bacterium]